MATTQSKRTVQATWSHGPVAGAVVGFLACLFTAGLGTFWNTMHHRYPGVFTSQFKWWIPLGLAGFGIAAGLTRDLYRRIPRRYVYYRVGCWTGFGLWASWVIAAGWSLLVCVAAAAGAIVAGTLAAVFGRYIPDQPQPPAVPQQVVFQAAAPRETLEDSIRRQLGALLNIRNPVEWPIVRHARAWPLDAGHTFEVHGVPGKAISTKKLIGVCEDLTTELQLDLGCSCRAEQAGKHGWSWLHVSTRNYHAEDLPYPDDYRPLTIVKDFSVGKHPDGAHTMANLHQQVAIAAGQRGGGKTILLQNITATAVRCVDVLVWHIDLNGGALFAPWLYGHAHGEVETPPIDWVASTPDEALRMAQAAVRIAKARRQHYEYLMQQKNTDVLPVSPDLPLILIVVDEGYEVTGESATREQAAVSKALQELQRIGRAACVNTLWSMQRTTGDYLPSGLKRGASIVFCTRVADDDELQNVFGWKKGASISDLIYPGQMLMRAGGAGDLKLTKGYKIDRAQIGEIARAVQPIRRRVRLDQVSAAAANAGYEVETDEGELEVQRDDYADRWTRPAAAGYLARLRSGERPDAEQFGDGGVATIVRKTRPASSTTGPATDKFLQFTDGLQRQNRQTDDGEPPAADRPADSAGQDMTAEQLRDLFERSTFDPREQPPAAAPPAAPPPPPQAPAGGGGRSSRQVRRAKILDLLKAAGKIGMEPAAVRQALESDGTMNPATERNRQTVQEDLTALRSAGKVTQTRGGTTVDGRWWHIDFA